MRRQHHVSRFRDALHSCRTMEMYLLGFVDNEPLIIGNSREQALAIALWHEEWRRYHA